MKRRGVESLLQAVGVSVSSLLKQRFPSDGWLRTQIFKARGNLLGGSLIELRHVLLLLLLLMVVVMRCAGGAAQLGYCCLSVLAYTVQQ